jgi:hypothetical protein
VPDRIIIPSFSALSARTVRSEFICAPLIYRRNLNFILGSELTLMCIILAAKLKHKALNAAAVLTHASLLAFGVELLHFFSNVSSVLFVLRLDEIKKLFTPK